MVSRTVRMQVFSQTDEWSKRANASGIRFKSTRSPSVTSGVLGSKSAHVGFGACSSRMRSRSDSKAARRAATGTDEASANVSVARANK